MMLCPGARRHSIHITPALCSISGIAYAQNYARLIGAALLSVVGTLLNGLLKQYTVKGLFSACMRSVFTAMGTVPVPYLGVNIRYFISDFPFQFLVPTQRTAMYTCTKGHTNTHT